MARCLCSRGSGAGRTQDSSVNNARPVRVLRANKECKHEGRKGRKGEGDQAELPRRNRWEGGEAGEASDDRVFERGSAVTEGELANDVRIFRCDSSHKSNTGA